MNAAVVVQTLNAIQALLVWLSNRGIARDRVIALLNRADEENRDLTDAEVTAELDLTESELDETARLINED